MHVSSYYIFVYMLVGDNNSCDDADDPPINSHDSVDSNAKISSEKNAILRKYVHIFTGYKFIFT